MNSRRAVMATLVTGVTFVCAGSLNAQDVKARSAVGQPSLADSVLTQNVWIMLKVWAGAGAAPAGCADSVQLSERRIVEAPRRGDPRKHPWAEAWTVHRCGADAVYRVTFTPARGGTSFNITPSQ
jgi:hypothetical protein